MDRNDWVKILDRAIIAYRDNPTPENRETLMDVQRRYTDAFLARMAEEYARKQG